MTSFFSNDLLGFWAEWVRPSAGLPTVLWSLLLAAAAAAGHLVQRYMGMPKVVGYSVVGTVVGFAGFEGAIWPLQGISLFLLELGVAIVLFEAGGRLPLRWFRHNPMVLVQSLLEATLTYFCVFWVLHWLDVPDPVANPIALMAIVASPAVLSRVVMDTRASGPVTERAMTLATLNTFYALALGYAQAGLIEHAPLGLLQKLYPVAVVLGLSFVVGALMALSLRSALRVMSPASENTSILLLAIIAAGAALAAHFGGSAPLAALIGGVLLKALHPKPWAWPRQLGTAASLLTMLMFVLVSIVAAQADWSLPVASVVLAPSGDHPDARGQVGARPLVPPLGMADDELVAALDQEEDRLRGGSGRWVFDDRQASWRRRSAGHGDWVRRRCRTFLVTGGRGPGGTVGRTPRMGGRPLVRRSSR